MNERNAVTKEYMRQNDRFADVCNYYLFGGEPVIRAEDLEERDTTELAVLFKDSKILEVEKLRDMFSDVAPQILENVSDYKLNLLVPGEITDFKCFRTEFGRLMELFSCAENTEKVETLLQRDPTEEFVLSPKAVRLVNTCLNMNLELPEGEEDTKMCKALDELIARGESRGEERGEVRGTEKTYLSLVRDGLLELTVAAERLGKTPEEFKKLLAE